MTLKVLNLYAGIGGNRKLWDEVTDIDVTAVEWDEDKVEVYRDYFPEDEVIVTDAHEYLKEHIFDDWDFIWSSPPCPTHSRIEHLNHRQHGVRYPDFSLFEEVVLLKQYHQEEGYDYTVENVVSYYEPVYNPQEIANHFFWSNFHIPGFKSGRRDTFGSFPDRDDGFNYDKHEEMMGYDLSKYDTTKTKKGKMLRNCVHPDLGKHIFEAATTKRQSTLV